ncbi:MAG: dipeptidase [Chloroflexi bacterium]|nr:dipeptidase [Chloroflexota bacterium]MBI3341229.1 dipeptidase [Chloroflexota bacterium]
MLQKALEFASQNNERFLAELKEVLAIPSISTDPEHKADMQKAAEWMAAQLRTIGMNNVQIMPTGGHPVVYGDWMDAGKSAPTVMIYGHYDVQPADPLELWQTPPFEATVRGENLFARGSADMKGQVIASLKAAESVMYAGDMPVNLKWLIEGEEEIGSEHLDNFIKNHKELLKADFCLNADAGILAPDKPSITTGLRGLAYFELKVYGPKKDLHSGLYGGAVHNPAQALAELIAGMHDKNGKITLPGFYDKVRKLSKKEREDFARLPLPNKLYIEQTGVPALWGEPNFTVPERLGARPTLEVNGLLSGFTGPGSKTVLPAWAMAKISCRLVPDQTPEETIKQMKKYLKENAPKDITWELTYLHGAGAALVGSDNIGIVALSKAMQSVWGRKPYFLREGGSIGVVVQLQKHLGVDSVLSGFGLPDCDAHSPNEKLHLPTWTKGIDAFIHFFYNLK